MQLIILAAGYATRLLPLTRDTPKPLLPVDGRPMLEYVLEAATPIPGIQRAIIVTNHRFTPQFEAWAKNTQPPFPCAILNDGTTSNEDRLGAIGDLHKTLVDFAIDEDITVLAGDNLFTQPLTGFGEFCATHVTPCLGVYDVGSLEEAAKYGVVDTNAEARITSFEEKPAAPRSTLIGIALYHYPRAVLPEITRYLAEGNNPDQPGRLIQWLYPQRPVHAWPVPGQWLDIGSHETLAEAQEIFGNKTQA
ncbi:MAG: nucleoside-diphosphate-sugar pyrophosphorylase [Verrucomicrobiales bacterium]|nr:nucleoside-diphosphate-sugar pyrophosphorylase [Verrucomicrobiales bacterium]